MKSNQRKYLPVSLDITDSNILIIGGGKIAEQKLATLSMFTNKITILALEISSSIQLTYFKQIVKEYQPHDLNQYSIVYACTNNRMLNAQIKSDAAKRSLLVNVVDDPELCDFISPAIFKQDYMTVAVNSNGVNVKKTIAWRDKIKKLLENESDE
jgi:precorrin-2 dehydrogenase/sirohydrochlorin ferrochelatase